MYINYKDFTIRLNEQTEEWTVPGITDAQGVLRVFPTLKEAKTAIREKTADEKEEQAVLKPFWAIIKFHERKIRRVYLISINGRNGIVYYKKSPNAKKTESFSERWSTGVYQDTPEVHKLMKDVGRKNKAYNEAEKMKEKAEGALERKELSKTKIAKLLGKEDLY